MNTVQTMTIDSKDIHSAITSWSGYDFQGKVAIYVTLCILNNLDLNNEDLSRYFLEIEYLEDFSIKKNDSYLSIHQVKSFQNKPHFSHYKEAILELMGKCAKYTSIEKANLHTTSFIEVPSTEELKRSLINYNPRSKKINKLISYKQILSDHQRFDDALKKLSYNKCNDTPYDLVVDIDEIKNKIKEQLIGFYKKIHQEDMVLFNAAENIDYIYYNLHSELDKWIIKKHKGFVNKIIISFDVFYEILRNKNIFQYSDKTIASLLKEHIKECFVEFCEIYNINPNNDPKCDRWYKNWNYIRQLNDDEFILLCKKLSPHIVIKGEKITLLEFKKLLESRAVKETLIDLTLEFGNLSLELNDIKNVFVLNKLGIHHLITTIDELDAPYAKNKVAKKMIENFSFNNQLLDLFFDIHKIITTDLNGPYEGNIFNVKSTYQREQGKEIENKNSLVLPRNFEFISVKKAKEELR